MKKILTVCLLALMVNSMDAQQWMPIVGSSSIGLTDPAYCMYYDSTQNFLYIGGRFSGADTVYSPGIIIWDGAQWRPFGDIIIDHEVNDILRIGDTLYLAAYDNPTAFTQGWVYKFIIQGNQQVYDTTFFFNGAVLCLHEFENKLIVGGTFYQNYYEPFRRIAAWDGNNWSQIGNGFNPTRVSDLITYHDTLYAAGDFESEYGSTLLLKNIAKWDGSQWQKLGAGGVFGISANDGFVTTLEIYNDELYVGGNFLNAGGVSVTGIAKWNGIIWDTVKNNLLAGVYSITTIQNDLYLSGPNYDLQDDNLIVYDGLTFSNTGFGHNGAAYDLELVNDRLYAAGGFTTLNGDTFNHIGYMDIINSDQPLLSSTTFSVFPNPTTEIISLTLQSSDDAVMRIYNSLGQLVLQTVYNSNEPVEISALPAGFYSLLLTSQKKREAVSFIKQ